jgi:hypothetical protein
MFVKLFEEHVRTVLVDDEKTYMSETSNQVRALVHNDDSASSETRLCIRKGIEVHPRGFLVLL